MTKRCFDSTSPPLPHPKKVKTHVRDGKKSTIKKPKSNMKQGRSERCSKGVLSGPITKDEEEVAETLFALAGLFADKPNKGKAELLDPNPPQVPVSNDSPTTIQVSENLGISACSSVPTEAVNALPTAENLKAEPWNQPNLAYSEKLHFPPNDSSSAKNREQHDEKALRRSSAEFINPSDQLSDIRSKHALQKKGSFLEREPEMLSGMATPIGCQVELCQKLESKKSGMTLWPGSPSTTFPKAPRADDQPMPSSASKLPAWLDAACSGSRRTSAQNDSVAKVCKVPADRRLSKRCAMHVRVCHLIQALRTSDSEERLSPHLQSQMRAHEGLNRVVSSTTNGFNGYGISATPIVAATNAHPNSNLSEIGILNQANKRDRPQSAAASEVSSWQKQSFDMFMSLARDSSGRSRHGGSDSNPYLASLGQHQFGASFSLPQQCYNSSSDHFPTLQQVQMQLQSHITPLYSAQGGPQGTMRHHIRHQQEFSEFYNREERPMIQFLSLQSGGPTSPRPHQHQFPMTVASLPFSGGKVDRGGGFRTNAPLALQLLCSDRR